MSDTMRFRIERVPDDDGGLEWEVGVYRNGEWSGACCYDTGAEAIAAYNRATAEKAARA